MHTPSDRDDDVEAAAGRASQKYRASNFMRKEIALFHRARSETHSMRRYGDNDSPVPAVTPVRAVREIRPIRLDTGSFDVDA